MVLFLSVNLTFSGTPMMSRRVGLTACSTVTRWMLHSFGQLVKKKELLVLIRKDLFHMTHLVFCEIWLDKA